MTAVKSYIHFINELCNLYSNDGSENLLQMKFQTRNDGVLLHALLGDAMTKFLFSLYSPPRYARDRNDDVLLRATLGVAMTAGKSFIYFINEMRNPYSNDGIFFLLCCIRQ
jgi:hypothetical protein